MYIISGIIFVLAWLIDDFAIQDEQNLLVPIHAYPVMSTAKFPRHVRFPATPVGRTCNKTLSLECDIPIDFEFQLTSVQHHPAFIVTPMRGADNISTYTYMTVPTYTQVLFLLMERLI